MTALAVGGRFPSGEFGVSTVAAEAPPLGALAVAGDSYGPGEDSEPLAKLTKAAAITAIAEGAAATASSAILRFIESPFRVEGGEMNSPTAASARGPE